MSTEQVKRIMRDRQHLSDALAERDAERIKAHRSRFHSIVTNGKLRDLALAQMKELKQLHAEKAKWVQRSFPSFATMSQHDAAAEPRKRAATARTGL
jgi:hypothetical protein